MKKLPLLHLFVFAAGLAVIGWIATGYLGTHLLALAVTALIGALYLAGALELHRYRQATATLATALDGLSGPPSTLAGWLEPLHHSLRDAVRLRVEGERAALPVPALTPYLVGMLVLLGMLGTLLGMVLTLRGTGIALQTATDLQAIRDSLAAPVSGLGVAFGTSIAGVAASAMLGLLSALCRRERIEAVQRLDAQIATALRPHSRAHQREQAFHLLQRQSEAMPALVDRLEAMMGALEQQAQAAHARQAERQEAFHADTGAAYRQLAESVQQSLQASAADSARAAGQALQPVVEATMATLARETASLHASVAGSVQQQLQALSSGFADTTGTVAGLWQQALDEQRETNAALGSDLRGTLEAFGDGFTRRADTLLEGVSARLDASAAHMADAWNDALARQQAGHEALASRNQEALAAAAAGFEQHAAALLRNVDQSHAQLQARLAEQDGERLAAWRESIASLGEQVTAQARDSASATIAEIGALVQAAAEAPRAAAEVVAELRQKLSDSMARDTAMLAERTQLIGTLDTLLDAVNHASTEQRGAIDALVSTSADLLERVGTRFTDHIQAETGRLDTAAAQVSEGASDVAGLARAFAGAVQAFGDTSTGLMERLDRIEGALDKSLARSDEQLAYYVAQAREVVDLSMLAQRQIIEDLQRLSGPGAGARAGTEAEAA